MERSLFLKNLFASWHRSLRQTGFTLVEMLVVLAIMVIITAVAVSGQSQFNNSLILTDTAYTVGLSVRQAQSLGLSSQRFGSVTNAGYGLYFSTFPASSYALFADTLRTATAPSSCPTGTAGTPEAKPGNCLYDSATEQVQRFSFSRGFTITDVCGHDSGNVMRCTGTNFDSVSVVFVRPNTQTIITGVRATTLTQLTDAYIAVKAPGSSTAERCVTISQVGEISITQSACP